MNKERGMAYLSFLHIRDNILTDPIHTSKFVSWPKRVNLEEAFVPLIKEGSPICSDDDLLRSFVSYAVGYVGEEKDTAPLLWETEPYVRVADLLNDLIFTLGG